MDRKLLIIGARTGGLGAHMAEEARQLEPRWGDGRVVTAGVSGDEDTYVDITDATTWTTLILNGQFTDVVCTVGVNDPQFGFDWHLKVNASGPLQFCDWWAFECAKQIEEGIPFNFVGISSNSAHVPRSPSAPYCASKAALSMGLRTLGRKYARQTGGQVRIWGYEPGWLEGTPMSKDSAEALSDGFSPHRIPAGYDAGINPKLLCSKILDDMIIYSEMLQCTMQRIDMGDM